MYFQFTYRVYGDIRISFVAGFFYRRLTFQSSMSSNYWYVSSIIFKFVEVTVEYFFYKRVFVFLLFDFANFFMKLFLLQLKTKNAVKDINQNFMSNKLSEKKSKQLFAKSWFLNICCLNWFLLNFLWEVGAHQSKK